MSEDKTMMLDYECLQKYNENNLKFSMGLILEKKDGEDERFIGYSCLYRANEHRMKLEFDIATAAWKTNAEDFYPEDEQQMLHLLFDDLNHIQCLTLDQQIQLIIHRFDQYFAERFEDDSPKTLNHELIELSLSQNCKALAIPEGDETQKCADLFPTQVVDYGLQSLLTGNRPRFYGLGPPPVAPRRSRQNSACSTQSSVRYASFLPPPTAPVRRRRVIQSILLHVQRKKKTFEKLVDAFKQVQPVTMGQIGLEFLRLYDGKFNYREGHTFVLPFRKKTWFLTIAKIQCVECQVGEKEPRSVLLLSYKQHVTPVQV